MTTILKPLGAFAAVALFGAASCTRVVMSGDEMVAQCQAEVAPAGTYEYDPTTPIPVMTPIEDGTEMGARAFNQCIRRVAAQEGLVPVSSAFGSTGALCPDNAPPIYGGATYCLGSF